MTSHAMGKVEVQSDRAWVVYDEETGRIQHVHRVVTLKGGVEPEEGEVEARVLKMSAKRGGAASRLKTLVVTPAQLDAGATHSVDPKRRALVSKPMRVEGKRPTKPSK
jgi:hypothetical protein